MPDDKNLEMTELKALTENKMLMKLFWVPLIG